VAWSNAHLPEPGRLAILDRELLAAGRAYLDPKQQRLTFGDVQEKG
jgi:hypothetical protein